MSWFKLDDQFPHHPKVMRAGPDAAWLFVAGGCYCASHLTDGLIPKCALPTLSMLRNPEKLAARLVEVGLWIELDDDYEVNDYLEYNPSREDVEETRRAARERRAKGGQRSADVRANVSNPDPTRPDVLTEHKKTDEKSGQTTRKRASSPGEDFTPTDAHCEYARSHGLSLQDELDHWVDWCAANGRTYKNLNAGFSTWLRQAVGFGRGGPVGDRSPAREPALVLPPSRVEVCSVCESSMLACVCRRSRV